MTVSKNLGDMSSFNQEPLKLVRYLNERYEQRLAKLDQRTFAHLSSVTWKGGDAWEVEQEPVRRFQELVTECAEAEQDPARRAYLLLCVGWVKQLETARRELLIFYGERRVPTAQIGEIEERVKTLTERLRAVDTGRYLMRVGHLA